MWSNVVVVELITCENWAVLSFQASHNLLTVANLSVHSFHLVITDFSVKSKTSDVLRLSFDILVEHDVGVLPKNSGPQHEIESSENCDYDCPRLRVEVLGECV